MTCAEKCFPRWSGRRHGDPRRGKSKWFEHNFMNVKLRERLQFVSDIARLLS